MTSQTASSVCQSVGAPGDGSGGGDGGVDAAEAVGRGGRRAPSSAAGSRTSATNPSRPSRSSPPARGLDRGDRRVEVGRRRPAGSRAPSSSAVRRDLGPSARSTRATRQPAAASRRPVAAPMPRAPPVITRHRPVVVVSSRLLTSRHLSELAWLGGGTHHAGTPDPPTGRPPTRATRSPGVATGTGRRPTTAATRSATRSSSRARPSSAEAPVGSPSTPLGVTAARPPARRSSSSSGERRGHAGLGPVEADDVRGDGQQQRRLGAAGVAVGAAEPGRPHHDRPALGSQRRPRAGQRARRCRRGRSRARPAANSGADRPDQLDHHQLERVGADRQRPGEALVLAAGAVGQGRGDHRVDRPAERAPPPRRRRRPPRPGCRCRAAGAGRAARSSRAARAAPRAGRPTSGEVRAIRPASDVGRPGSAVETSAVTSSSPQARSCSSTRSAASAVSACTVRGGVRSTSAPVRARMRSRTSRLGDGGGRTCARGR